MLSLRDLLAWEDLPKTDFSLIRQRKLDWREKPMLLCATFQRESSRRLWEVHNLINQLESHERPSYDLMIDLLIRALQYVCPDGVHPSYTDPSVVESYVGAFESIRKDVAREDSLEIKQKVRTHQVIITLFF
jgi:hypothetical protein